MTYVREVSPQRSMGRGPASSSIWIEPAPLRDGLPEFHSDPLIHAILARRLADAAEAVDFLNADERTAPDPHLLPGMTEAAERIAAALRRGSRSAFLGTTTLMASHRRRC